MPAMAKGGPADAGDPTGGVTLRVGRRFLPVAACVLPPLTGGDGGTLVLAVAPGTPVHAIAAGRVLAAEDAAVGEVVVRIEDEVRLGYRRLHPASVAQQRGDRIEAGDLLGVVGRPADGGTATLELSASHADGGSADLAALLVGAADPQELLAPTPTFPGLTDTRRTAGRLVRPSPATPSRPDPVDPGPRQPTQPQPTSPEPATPPAADVSEDRRAANARSLQGRPRPRRREPR